MAGQRHGTKARFEKWERFIPKPNQFISVPKLVGSSLDVTDYSEWRRSNRVIRLLKLAQDCQARAMWSGMEVD